MAKKRMVTEGKPEVVVILGSPRRNGNSATLAGAVAAGARAAGAQVETFFIHGMRVAPCSACEICRKNTDDDCVIDDDMRPLYPKLRRARAIVIASPIYRASVSAQTKLFFDRCYALGGPQGNAQRGKRFGIVLTYGDEDPIAAGAVNAVRMFEDAFAFVGANLVGIVHAFADKPGEVRRNRAAMKRARELGRELVAGA